MSNRPEPERALPSKGRAALFHLKAGGLRLRRGLREWGAPVPRHPVGEELREAEVIAESRAELWNHRSDAEFPLTAGKVQNLRIACRSLHGIEIPAGTVFSFWKQLGRVTTRSGYSIGRELREGCLIPNLGGGLCQLSNLLYGAALDAGFEIVERHAHSRIIPGSLAEQDRDATVFWNYVDLRFRSPQAYRLEALLTATHLTVRILARGDQAPAPAPSAEVAPGTPQRSRPSGDCLTCGMVSCFRHPSATADHRPAAGHSAFLLDELWPEYQKWCTQHSREGDHWFVPLDGHRWNKPNYAWSTPSAATPHFATMGTLVRALRHRHLPAQGAARQRALLERDTALATNYARRLDPQARHLVVSQNLLPHLWRLGVLGGRTFDVLMTRWPITELQRRLDDAHRNAPDSTTLSDFRADPQIAHAEQEALAAAARLITPHRALAAHFGARALLLDWEMPAPNPNASPASSRELFFPASPLGRKGIYQLAEAAAGFDLPLRVLGRATEDGPDPLAAVPHRSATRADLASASIVILPAWIEHQPRLLLQALANGTPVIASAACGLGAHPLYYEIDEPDSGALRERLADLLAPAESESKRAS